MLQPHYPNGAVLLCLGLSLNFGVCMSVYCQHWPMLLWYDFLKQNVQLPVSKVRSAQIRWHTWSQYVRCVWGSTKLKSYPNFLISIILASFESYSGVQSSHSKLISSIPEVTIVLCPRPHPRCEGLVMFDWSLELHQPNITRLSPRGWGLGIRNSKPVHPEASLSHSLAAEAFKSVLCMSEIELLINISH